jgi:hypothetical protein
MLIQNIHTLKQDKTQKSVNEALELIRKQVLQDGEFNYSKGTLKANTKPLNTTIAKNNVLKQNRVFEFGAIEARSIILLFSRRKWTTYKSTRFIIIPIQIAGNLPVIPLEF